MNKQQWLEEAISYIDSLNTREFEKFLFSCVSYNLVKTNYADIQYGKFIVISKAANEAANMDSYHCDDISLAA